MKPLMICFTLSCLAFAQAPLKYEMTNYVVGFLMKGPKWTAESSEETKRIQEGHMGHIRKMADSGKLIVAGPFTNNGDLRGMLVFKDISLEDARKMAEDDPAVKSGRMAVKLHPWFAGKGLNVPPPGKQ